MVSPNWCHALCALVMLLMLTVVTGCASYGPPIVLTARFDPQAAAFINASGRAKISGQAFIRQNDGKLLRATGTDVFLVPRTAYADARIAAIYGDGKQAMAGRAFADTDPLYDRFTRQTIASSGGSFSFDHVADGAYYVIAMIHLPSDYSFYQMPILERVTVAGGKSVRLVMRGY